MNCKRVQKLLPLFVGEDLSPRKMSEVRIHLDKCSACLKEYETYEMSLIQTKRLLVRERKDWEDKEWELAIQRAVIDKPTRVSSLMPWPYKKSWAYALMALLVVVLTFFVIRSANVDIDEQTGTVTSKAPSGILVKEPQQQVVSLTMVSSETGLKMAWFFNRDFNFEEEK